MEPKVLFSLHRFLWCALISLLVYPLAIAADLKGPSNITAISGAFLLPQNFVANDLWKILKILPFEANDPLFRLPLEFGERKISGAVTREYYFEQEVIALGNEVERLDSLIAKIAVGGKTFSVPIENLASLQPSSQASPFPPIGKSEFLAHFSAAWLSAHVDGYQPVLNHGFESHMASISVGEQVAKDHARLHPVSVDLWYKRGAYANRVVMDKKEPNTGFYIIQPIPYSSEPDHDREQWFLSETLPDESKSYPENPHWRPYICRRTNGIIIENAKVLTKCNINGKSADDIFFYTYLSSENLRVRETVLSTIAEEIRSWIIDEESNNDS